MSEPLAETVGGLPARAPTSASPPSLQEEAEGFASRVNEILQESLGHSETVIHARSSGAKVSVRAADPKGVALYVNGVLTYRLKISYRCAWNGSRHFLAVEQSSFTFFHERTTEPLFHFDYLRNPRNVPASHINIHTEHAAFHEAVADGKPGAPVRKKGAPRNLHIPAGGHRFRPTVEDALEMIITEFHIDHVEGWQAHIQNGRAMFRETQLSAAVTDHPARAAEALRGLGYRVEWPKELGEEPPIKWDKFTAY